MSLVQERMNWLFPVAVRFVKIVANDWVANWTAIDILNDSKLIQLSFIKPFSRDRNS